MGQPHVRKDKTVCPHCGRELRRLGVYADMIHYRADRSDNTPCMVLPETAFVRELAAELARRVAVAE